ncbi:hypothetical protein [Sulfurovum riftiae]|uniref:Uncharacterized protein n=1 Tax=Sulfurovum riftiae TaxID=1630136 RepID=A0A151CJT9_9BACT|nr:hypothetical protein [Sulfurovum riftiae]KYJ87523.1 hypothetical protein AS592_10475 [Sulfurovum riftiae]
MNKIQCSISNKNVKDKPKAFTNNFMSHSIESLENLLYLANRYSLSAPLYKGRHRASHNIIQGGNLLLIDCDEAAQFEAIEVKIQPYDYVKVPSASNCEETPYKWHYFIPTQEPLSMYPAAFRFQVEQFFQQVGITDEMIDTTGSYDIARQFAPASIKLDPSEADALSEVNETGLNVPIVETPQELCNTAVKSIEIDVGGVNVQKLPPGYLWYKGKAINYTDVLKAVKEVYGNNEEVIVSGFGCPYDNHHHTMDRTRGYGFAFFGNDGDLIVKCTGNECNDNPYFKVQGDSAEVESVLIEIEMKTYPIHPDNFGEVMKERIRSLNPQFHTEGVIVDGFRQYCAAYNDCVSYNSMGDSTQIIIPSSTGSGKSVSSRLYLAQIAKLGLSGLLVVSEVATAIEAVIEINKLAGSNVAGTYYSVSEVNPDSTSRCEIDSLSRITVITHAMFIQRSDSQKDIDLLKKHNEKQRDIIIIDERISLVKSVSFSTGEVDDAIGILKRDTKLYDLMKALENLNEIIFKTKVHGSYTNDGGIKEIFNRLNTDIARVIDGLHGNKYNISRRIRGKRKDNQDTEKEALIFLLERIGYVVAERFNQTIEGSYVICHREEDLSSVFGSVVVLDATSTVNPEYDYRAINNHDIKLLERIIGRNYSPVTLNICNDRTQKQSRSGIYKNLPSSVSKTEIIKVYLKIIEDILKEHEKLLVVTYKDIVPLFKEYSPFKDRVIFIHWGGRDARGSNEYADFDAAIAIGWNRKPQHSYISSVMAIRQMDEYIALNGSIMKDANMLKDMLIVDDLIQFFNRTRCRTTINVEGECAPVALYLFTGGNRNMETLIKEVFEVEMPDIHIKRWGPVIPQKLKRKKSKLEERADNFIAFLRGNIEKYEVITLAQLREYFELRLSMVSKVIKSLYFQRLLEDENISMVGQGRRKDPVRFIMPPQQSFS